MLLARILTPRGGIGERSASGSGLRQSLPSLSTATDGHGQESRKTLPGQGQQSQVTPGRAKILLHSPPPQLGKRQLNPVRPRSQGTRGASPLTTLQWEGMGGGASREPTRANPPLPPSGQAPLKDGEETEGGGGGGLRAFDLQRGRGRVVWGAGGRAEPEGRPLYGRRFKNAFSLHHRPIPTDVTSHVCRAPSTPTPRTCWVRVPK